MRAAFNRAIVLSSIGSLLAACPSNPVGGGGKPEPPTALDVRVTTDEDTPITVSSDGLGFSDKNGDALFAVIVTTLPTAGNLLLNGQPVAAGQTIGAAELTDAHVSFVPAPNAHGAPYATFTFQVQDDSDQDNLDLTPNTVTIDVTSVNDAPHGSDQQATTFVGADLPLTTFGFSDPDDVPANTLAAVEITTLPSTGTLSQNGVGVTTGQLVSAADIAANALVFTPAGAGTATFTFRVKDDGGGTADTAATASTFTITVAAVNTAPSGADATVSTLEDTAYPFAAADFGFSDPDDAFAAVRVTTTPASGALANDGLAVGAGDFVTADDLAAGRLVFTPAANGHGTVSFTFQVQDDGGTDGGGVDLDPTPRTLSIAVTSVNDAPVGADHSLATPVDTPVPLSAAAFPFTDPNDNPANALEAVEIVTLPSSGTLTLSGSPVSAGQVVLAAELGDLLFTPTASMFGLVTLTARVRDDGGTTNSGVNLDATARTLSISVVRVNNAPQGSDGTVTADEDVAYAFQSADFGFSDPNDAPPHAFLAVKIVGLPALGTLLFNGNAVNAGDVVPVASLGQLTFTGDPDEHGASYATIAFQVRDDGGTLFGGVDLDPTPRTLTIDLTSVNDAPDGTDNTLTLAEDSSLVFGVSDFGLTDAHDSPTNGFAGLIISSLPASGQLTVNGIPAVTGQPVTLADFTQDYFGYTPAPNSVAPASFAFRVFDDGGGTSDTDPTPNTLSFSITPVPDPPSGQDNDITTAEDAAYTLAAADFGFSDPNDTPPNVFAGVAIAAVPNVGSFELNGTPVVVSQVISRADIDAGLLRFTPATNGNGDPYAAFSFYVRDDAGSQDQDPTAHVIVFHVTPVNDPPQGANDTISVTEDGSYTFIDQSDFGYADPIEGDAFAAVKISTLPAAGTLRLNGVDVVDDQVIPASDLGLLVYRPASNQHGVGYASIGFQVQDVGGTLNGGVDLDASENTIAFDVSSVNDAPVGATGDIHFAEDTTYTFAANDFGFSDPNDSPANAFVSVTIVDTVDSGSLLLNSAPVTDNTVIAVADLGDLTFAAPANSNGSPYASFTFAVTDDGGGSNTDPTPKTIFLHVDPANDSPTDILLFAATGSTVNGARIDVLGPSVPMGTTLATLGAVDPEPSDTFTFELVSGAGDDDNARFTIVDLAIDELRVGASELVAADQGTYRLRIRVTDNGGAQHEKQFTVSFGSAPTDVALAPTGVFERAPTGTTVGTLTATDPDIGETFTFALSTGCGPGLDTGNASFTIAGNTLTTATVLDFEATPTLAICVRATDASSLFFDRALTVAVADVNDPPAGADKTVTTNEDTAYVFAASDFGFSDAADATPDSLSAVRIATLPGAGGLFVGAAPVSVGDFVLVANLATLQYVPPTNANGASFTSFTFQAQDDGGTANGGIDFDPTPNTITVNLTPVQDAPVVTMTVGAMTYVERAAATVVDNGVTISHVDGSQLTGASVTFQARPDGLSEVLNTDVSGTAIALNWDVNTGVLTLSNADSVANYESVLRKVTYRNTAHAPTAARNLLFTVNDGGNSSAAAAKAVNVTAVNSAPLLVSPLAFSVNEDTAFPLSGGNQIFVSDPDAASGRLLLTLSASHGTLALGTGPGAVTAITGNNTALVTADGTLTQLTTSLSTLTYTGVSNYNGGDSISIVLDDQGNTGTGGALTDSDTITVTVNAVNDKPIAGAFAVSVQSHLQRQISVSGNVSDPDASDVGFSGTLGLTGVVAGTGCGSCLISNVTATTFDLDPPPGASGPVSVRYRVVDNGNPAPGLVSDEGIITVNVSGPPIWFVGGPSGASGAGRGTLARPLANLAGVTAASASRAGHRIFIYSGSYTADTTNFTLGSGEWIVGQPAIGGGFDSYFGISPPAGTIARPTVNASTVTLANHVTAPSNNKIDSVNFSLASGVAIVASGANNLTVTNSGVSGGAGGINAPSVTGTVTVTNFSATGVNAVGGLLFPTHAATITLSNLGLTTNALPALQVTASSLDISKPLTLTGTTNTISTTTGRAVEVRRTAIGGAGMTLSSVNVNGAPNAIVLDTTGSVGAFAVTGSGAVTGSCGTIASTTSNAIELISTTSVTLKNMIIGDTLAVAGEDQPDNNVKIGSASSGSGIDVGAAIYMASVTPKSGDTFGLVLDNVTISRTKGDGIHGGDVTGAGGNNVGLKIVDSEILNAGDMVYQASDPGSDSAIYFGSGNRSASMISGRVSLQRSLFAGFYNHGFSAENSGGTTLDMSVQNCVFENNDATNIGGSAIQIVSDGSLTSGTQTLRLLVADTTFTKIDLDGIEVTGDPGSTSHVTIQRTTHSSPDGDNAIQLSSGSPDGDDSEAMYASIQGVNVTAQGGTVLALFGGGGSLDVLVDGGSFSSGNTSTGVAAHQGAGVDISFDADDQEIVTGRIGISGATFENIGAEAIQLSTNELMSGSVINLDVHHSNLGTSGKEVARQFGPEGIEVRAGTTLGAVTANLRFFLNTIRLANPLAATPGSEGLDIDSELNATVNATITQNTFFNPTNTARAVSLATEQASSSMCANMTSTSNSGASHTPDYELLESAGAFTVFGPGSAAVTISDIQTAQTNGSATVTSSVNSITFNNNTTCTLPATPIAPSGPVGPT